MWAINAIALLLGTTMIDEPVFPFTPMWFSADECCHWQPRLPNGLRMNEHYIAPPTPGQDRVQWLRDATAFRDRVRAGDFGDYVYSRYDGERAWVRATRGAAQALDLRPGDTLDVMVKARGISGNTTLCVVLDFIERADGTYRDCTGVFASHVFPIADAPETHTFSITVPDFDSARFHVRPIVGIDFLFDKVIGEVEILDIDCAPRGREADVRAQLGAFARPALDRSVYDRPDLAWASRAFTCHFTFMYDSLFYDPEKGYTVDRLLDDGAREFGGYDALVLWQGYPRLGVDDRNQFDTYRDMPGGLPALREVVARCHARGVKVFIDYNPWDTGTRRPQRSDEEELIAIVEALNADGIFLDTLSTASLELRPRLDALRPGLAIAPEIHPPIEQLGISSLSWAQWLDDFAPPGMLHLKWIEPRHMQHQIRRWDTSHRAEIETAFFNGSGMLVWENVFASFNPWPTEDRARWRQCSEILRAFAENFASEAWDPFIPTQIDGVYAHRWPTPDATVYTLRNMTENSLANTPSIAIDGLREGEVILDLFQRVRIAPGALPGPADSLAAYAVLRENDPRVAQFTAQPACPKPDDALHTPSPLPVRQEITAHTTTQDFTNMALVPGGPVRVKLAHMRRECGCYPDPGTPAGRIPHFLTGNPFSETLEHDYTVDLKPFYIDKTHVTNAQFKTFLDASGYQPADTTNFLKHWPNGTLPDALADHPVVYVDLNDARAYAAWAGKRLPAEPEWHKAAQGDDAREWPWGNEFDESKCATGNTAPVNAHQSGKSPHGCLDMAGNVWHWLDAEYNDGHTRFAIIRGGSYFNAQGSGWYVPGGPQPLTSHAKLVLMSPSLDRSPTIGFRCAADAP